MHLHNQVAPMALARSLGHRPIEVGRRRRGVLTRRAIAKANARRGGGGRHRLRMGQAGAGQQAFTSIVPIEIESCFDVDLGMIVGGYLDGVSPHPGSVVLYTDDDGYERAAIDVAGDAQADLPVCYEEPPPPVTPPKVTPPGGRIPPPPPGDGNGDRELPPGLCPPEGPECETYGAPPTVMGPDGCDIGYNGCGDTIGVNVNVAANVTVDVNIPAAIEFAPRYFIYTGALATFKIDRIFVANGPNSNFGAGYSADYYALTSFTSKRISWPLFYNSPALSVTVTNLTGAQAAFQGLLIGIASHQ